jgi:hypothetical protein
MMDAYQLSGKSLIICTLNKIYCLKLSLTFFKGKKRVQISEGCEISKMLTTEGG